MNNDNNLSMLFSGLNNNLSNHFSKNSKKATIHLLQISKHQIFLIKSRIIQLIIPLIILLIIVEIIMELIIIQIQII